MMSATAAAGLLTRDAGIRNSPVSSATVTTTLRARVSRPAGLHEPIRDPASDRLARPEHEIRQRGVDARRAAA